MVSKLRSGKIPVHVLQQILGNISRGESVVTPSVGVDVGVTKSKGRYIITSSDPITGAVRNLAWHAVNVSANDVATSGIMPDTINVVALFPSQTRVQSIIKFMKDMNQSAREIGITVAGGHTEITPGLDRPIVIVTALGSGDLFLTSGGAKPNDVLLMTKTAGIEGTSIISQLSKIRRMAPKRILNSARSLGDCMSVVEEARLAFKTGHVHAMHDVTEGGVLGAAYEMSLASGLGIEIQKQAIPIAEATRRICEVSQTDPLTLLGSGSLLIACASGDDVKVKSTLERAGIQCASIGRFLSNSRQRYLVTSKGNIRLQESSISDGLWRALEEYS